MMSSPNKTKTLLVLMIIIGSILFLFYSLGSLQFNHPNPKMYPVKGIDVSEYQSQIDWPVLADNDLTFAFIKATEGSNYQDERFAYNFREAQKTNLRIGAYHFFSFESKGQTQAENYIATVPILPDALPPVVDLEYYGSFTRYNSPNANEVRAKLTVLLNMLESYYGKRPIIYVSNASYTNFVAGYFTDYPIWIRNFYACPILKDQTKWSFWQYSDRAVLPGYKGYATNIDMNVYNGTLEAFNAQFGY